MRAMPVAFKTIALIGRYKSRDVAAPLSSLGRFLEKQGCRVLIDEQTALGSGVRAFRVAKFEEIGARADLVVVLGGDGSMLSTARALAPQRVPLVGINQGRLGFTTDIALSSMRTSMRAILAGDFKTERRTMLYGTVDRRRKSAASAAGGAIAMNDIVVSKGATGRLIERTELGSTRELSSTGWPWGRSSP